MQNKMKLKSTIDLEELPADADETMTGLNACFLMLRLKFHQIQSSTFFGVAALLVFPSKTQNPMNSQTYFQERTVTPFPSVFDELRRTSIWKWAGQLERRASYYPCRNRK
jgi:hypothetical protein